MAKPQNAEPISSLVNNAGSGFQKNPLEIAGKCQRKAAEKLRGGIQMHRREAGGQES
ncbi:hypothetical protein Pla100_57240 [Neorhodopirellula pilleata]|uniref:Uncharacterized protein n=1 Tax=Neorhodopirellula pilleata TaxID=2714738 RepID=A0A5C5ZKQ3_9BACT|nr:hypothetical protein Pla100_57240 [Neorhodopirellula pilleata]